MKTDPTPVAHANPTRHPRALTLGVAIVAALLSTSAYAANGDAYYTDEQVYRMRPEPNREKPFGYIGATGILVRIHRDVTLKVEKILPDSPADGKFKTGETLTGINGIALKGKNPYVALGDALTKAEATDGQMVFDVLSTDGKTRKQAVQIPVLGTYSKTWPLNCDKSKKIIQQTADFYADRANFNQGGIPGALTCLFLLSTGDDKYLPRVKDYFDSFPKDVNRIGDHTWNNGYNGIACAEYYLRTGDKSVLPIIQYYCDDAKRRQKFGCSWTHWGNGIGPGYVAGGLLNAAGAQLLTTLLLGKECGVEVDEQTLLGSLRFFYRFAGRGTVPYGDHRGEGGLGSNGKDGMIAAAMQIAAGAQGDTTIYKEARDYMALSMITSYPLLAQGHGDDGRSDAIWRSIISAYLMEQKPDLYRQAMDRLTWWHDLSREAGGSMGVATLVWSCGQIGSTGPGIAMSYTAPLHTLRITSAPPTQYSRKYKLPEHLWGTPADRAFLSIEHNPRYFDYGSDEPTHIPFYLLGGAYHQPTDDLKSVPSEAILKNVYHRRYMIRTQAGKALRITGAFDELEKLLRDPDPRIKRAALDGMIDYNYWFAIGRNPIKTEQFSPAMLSAIKKILSDPEESWWVVDGALMAMKFAPAKDIMACKSLILTWTRHEDWWLRESAFTALSGLDRDDDLYRQVLPTMLKLLAGEYHTQPRERMLNHFRQVLRKAKSSSPIGKLIIAGLKDAVQTSEVKTGPRSPEGAYNVAQVATVCLQDDPTTAATVAQMLRKRLDVFSTDDLIKLVATENSSRENPQYGLYTALEQQSPEQRKVLTDILYNVYRVELLNRLKADLGVTGTIDGKNVDLGKLRAYGENGGLVDTILDLAKLNKPVAGWTPVGKTGPADRVWRYRSFDPLTEKDIVHQREKKRFRNIQLPDELNGWHEANYDDSKWSKGRAPIGVGECRTGRTFFENHSDWGKGEFLVMRTTFQIDNLDCDLYRLSILARQGYNVYLNGHRIQSYGWWKDRPYYRTILLDGRSAGYLKKGTNVLAAYGNVEYDSRTHEPRGQMDLYIEGLKISDLQ